MSGTTTTETTPYHEYEPYGLRCRRCDAPEFASIHRQPSPQPALDAGQQWRVEHFTKDGADEWMVVNGSGARTIAIANTSDPRVAEVEMRQIVSDHSAASSVPKLVETLDQVRRMAKYIVALSNKATLENARQQASQIVIAVDEALAIADQGKEQTCRG